VFVATDGDGPSHVFAYDGTGHRLSDITITGQPDHHSRGITGLAMENGGALIAIDAATARVLRLDPASGRQATVATIVDLPSCVLAPGAPRCEPGLEDHKPFLSGVAVAADGTIYIADSAQATVWRIRNGREPEAWSQSVFQASGDGPTAIAVAPDGSVLCTVGTDLNPSNATAPSLYRIPVRGDGRSGNAVLVAKLFRGDQPTGLAAGPDGQIYVALHGTSSIVVLRADGAEVTRLRAPAIDGPMGLALASGGNLLATTQPLSGPSQLLRIRVAGAP
jgi:DNA-binding beta-propeller fold protein YncE